LREIWARLPTSTGGSVLIATDGAAVSTAGVPGLAVRAGVGRALGAADTDLLAEVADGAVVAGVAGLADEVLPAAPGCALSPEQAVATAPVTSSAMTVVRALCRAVAFTLRDFTRGGRKISAFRRCATA
jgi:hypothetical protein